MVILGINAYADIADEAMLMTARVIGTKVYLACIVTPPVTPAEEAFCSGLYDAYVASLAKLNSPLPLVRSVDPDPYVWRPFDICRYETGHIVFTEPGVIPFCPVI